MTNFNIVGLMLVKDDSKRLAHKNTKMLCGKQMFLWNLKKALKVLDKVYVSSESDEILRLARENKARVIKRPIKLCGDTPNITVYQHAIEFMDSPDIIMAIQANSPNLEESLITDAKYLMEYGFKELMTCHEDHLIYGSIWAIRKIRLINYGDPYKPRPEVLLVDDSIDIHNEEDFKTAQRMMSYAN